MTREDNVEVVESYIHGLGKGDFSDVPFADDVSYESPMIERRVGDDAIGFLSGLFPIIRSVEIVQHIVEGEHVATVFKLRTPNGETLIFDKFKVVDGKLTEIDAYYDPSVMNEAVQSL